MVPCEMRLSYGKYEDKRTLYQINCSHFDKISFLAINLSVCMIVLCSAGPVVFGVLCLV